jgi:CRISPR/Cas system CMR-associated protein Cmr1 (group 7 of RAMP superfamily)
MCSSEYLQKKHVVIQETLMGLSDAAGLNARWRKGFHHFAISQFHNLLCSGGYQNT